MESINEMYDNVVILNRAIYLGNKYLEINLVDFQNSNTFSNPTTDIGEKHFDCYDLSEILVFLIRLYKRTLNLKFLDKASNIAVSYINEASEANTPITHLGMGFVCSKLYAITDNSVFLDYALRIINFEESVIANQYKPEQIILRNLFTLLELYTITKSNKFLLKINLSILKLLNYSSFEKGGIYWSSLYQLNPVPRETEENMLRLVFLELYKVFKNDTFLYVSDNILTRHIQLGNINQAVHSNKKTVEEKLKADQSKIENITLNLIVLLSKSFSKGESNFLSEIPVIVKKIIRKNRIRQNFSTLDSHILSDYVSGVAYYYNYKYTLNERYLQLSNESFNKISKILSETDGKNVLQSLSDIFILNNCFLKEVLFDQTEFDRSVVHYKVLNTGSIFKNYPGISFSKSELKQLILLNRFPKVITLLRDRIPQKLNHHFNLVVTAKSDETSRFLKFVRVSLKLNTKLKKELNSILKIELTGFHLMNKQKAVKHIIKDNTEKKNKLLKLSDDQFIFMKLKIYSGIKYVTIKWNDILKIHAFTFKQHFVNTKEDFIIIRYNPLKHCVEEFVVDNLLIIILNAFKSLTSIEDAINSVMNFIDHSNEQLKELRKLVIKRIKNLIKKDFLCIEEQELIEYNIQ